MCIRDRYEHNAEMMELALTSLQAMGLETVESLNGTAFSNKENAKTTFINTDKPCFIISPKDISEMNNSIGGISFLAHGKTRELALVAMGKRINEERKKGNCFAVHNEGLEGQFGEGKIYSFNRDGNLALTHQTNDKGEYHPVVHVVNSDAELVATIENIFGGSKPG